MKFFLALFLLFGIATAQAANVTTSVSSNTLTLDAPGPITLTWTVTGAGKCTATGDWTGSKNVIGGTETISVTKTSTFGLTCESPTGPAKVLWTPPSILPAGGLKGYYVFSGPSVTQLARLIEVPGATNTSVQVQTTPGPTYFVVRSVDTSGVESVDSNSASKTVVADKATSAVTVELTIRPNPPTNVTVL